MQYLYYIAYEAVVKLHGNIVGKGDGSRNVYLEHKITVDDLESIRQDIMAALVKDAQKHVPSSFFGFKKKQAFEPYVVLNDVRLLSTLD